MSNAQGEWIWYEFMAVDADAATDFYQKVLGWTIIKPDRDNSGLDYRMIDTGGGDFVGGLLPLSTDMIAGGAKPG